MLRLSLPAAAAATLQLIDVAGRVIADRELGSLGAGTHEVHIAPEGRVAPGILWVRLTQGGKAVLTKAVLLQ